MMNMLLACSLSVAAAFANTEKAIFLGPAPVVLPDAGPSLDDLKLSTITPEKPSIRTALPAAFSSDEQPAGIDTWYLVNGLNETQRYELRVCWAAVPTRFDIDIFNITHVFDTPDLIQSLAAFAYSRHSVVHTSTRASQGSSVFLRVRSAADFYTTNKTLMVKPPPVDVDIILDPYIGNVLPASLVPTAIYITVVAVSGWLLSNFIWKTVSSSIKQHPD